MFTGPNIKELPVKVSGSSVFGRYPKISIEKTYNMFQSDEWMVCLGGYEKILHILPQGVNGEGRALFNSIRGGFLIAVVNANVYRINPTFGAMFIGSLSTQTGEVIIDENLMSQICIVDGQYIYIYNWGSNVFGQATAMDLFADVVPSYVCFHDQNFLIGNSLNTSNNQGWAVYGPGTGLTINAINQQLFTTKPDYPLAIKRIPGQSSNVLVLGNSVSEIQGHVPTTGIGNVGLQAYQRNPSVSIDYGCISVHTIASNEEYIVWLGTNESTGPVIMVFDGQKAIPISSDGIDYLLNSLSHPEQSTAIFFRQDGHLFYMISFYFMGDKNNTADNLSLLYDFNTKKFFHASDHKLDYHPARQCVYFNESLYFINKNNGDIYRWDTDITSIIEDIDDGLAPLDPRLIHEMQRIRICDTIRAPKTTPFIVECFSITIDQGNDEIPPEFPCVWLLIAEDAQGGIRLFSENNAPSPPVNNYWPKTQLVPEGHGVNNCMSVPYRPKVQLAISKNGGETFSNYFDRLLNSVAHRANILKWLSLGYCNEFTPKLRFWGKGRFIFNDGVATINVIG